MAFVVSGKSAAETTQRLKESHDAQIASAYLATDVQSAQADHHGDVRAVDTAHRPGRT